MQSTCHAVGIWDQGLNSNVDANLSTVGRTKWVSLSQDCESGWKIHSYTHALFELLFDSLSSFVAFSCRLNPVDVCARTNCKMDSSETPDPFATRR
ncbi:hypothetical protein N7501_011582 [Penicillium viridicatum]|nr:hypothetical protein N7501_011582 [Penicillium viridicatum]